jgi:P4 family phage/plasmid primase-like protien
MKNREWNDVTGKEPCQICGSDTWCSVSNYSNRAICRHQSNWENKHGKHKTDRNGADFWIFNLAPTSRRHAQKASFTGDDPKLASVAERDEVYRHLLCLLPLNDRHQSDLVARGFKLSEIEKCLYKSHPGAGREQVAELLVEKFGVDRCKQVPGILFKTEDELEYPVLGGKAGILLPTVNAKGQIVAVNIRADKADANARYTYLSSSAYDGPSPGVSVHVPQAAKALDTQTVRITEGVIKADLATAMTDVLTISVPGVTNWKLAIEAIEELNTKKVLIAFDADFREKVMVARSLINLYETLTRKGINVLIETWNASCGKGIDDLLNNKEKPKELSKEEADKLILELKEAFPLGSALESEPKPSYADIATGFLNDKKWYAEGHLLLRYWRENFYLWNGRCYRRISKSDLRAEVVGYVQSLPMVREKSGAKHGNEVLANIEALTLVRAETETPCWLDGRDVNAKFCIPMLNGVLDVKALLADSPSPLLPHSPEFFCLSHVPYGFDPSAPCPNFDKFFKEALPDQEVRDFLQEWFGYNLVHDTTQAKFVILVGQGANGKSVICVILRTLLGEDNVSSITLDQISSERTFPLATTAGKLANVVEEMEEITKAAEGILKNFIGGGVITLEQKFKDPVPTKATARLTFATNTLPKLSDRTDGIWRRLVVIPFTVQILDEAKQDKRLIDPKFWVDSGEIKGIFNFAIEGLRRLEKRKAFLEPEKCRAVKVAYREDMNIVGQFLDAFCEPSSNSAVASNHLYGIYRDWCISHGFEVTSAQRFALDVKQRLPKAELTKNPLAQLDGSRSREWQGIRLSNTHGTQHSN